jgi:hypothetical protein
MTDDLEPAARRDLALVNRRVAIELSALGLIQVSPDEADLLAFSLARTRSGTGIIWSCVGGAWGGYWVWDYAYHYDPCIWLEPVYVEVERTGVIVGLFDPLLSEVTFAGIIRGLGDGSRSRQIARAVDRIFTQYPARPTAPDGASAGTDGGSPDLDGGVLESDAAPLPIDAGPLDAGALDAGSAEPP